MAGPQVTVALPGQVQGILTPERGGTGYSIAAGQVLAEPWENTSTATIAVGSVVRRISDGTWRTTGIEAVASDTAQDVLGVVIGAPDASGRLDTVTAIPKLGDAGSAQALVAMSGIVPVLLAEDVAAGEWAAPTTIAGKVSGMANPSLTTFGQFIETGASGGTARLRIGSKSGRPTPGGIAPMTIEAGDLSAALAAGLGTWKSADFAGLITGLSLTLDIGATIEIDVLRSNMSTPAVAGTGSIFGGVYPSLASSSFGWFDASGSWSTAVTIHDVFRLEVRSVAGGPTRVTCQLAVRQT